MYYSNATVSICLLRPYNCLYNPDAPSTMSNSIDPQDDPATPAVSSTSPTPISALFPPIIPNTAYLIDDDSKPILRPYTTQRCFTFCSQSSVRRDTGWDPVCRAVCWKVDRSDELDKPRTPGYLDRQRAERAESSTSTLAQRKAAHVVEPSILDEFRESVSHWINQRSITAFKGTLEEMVEMQREGQRYDPAWDQQGSLKSQYFDSMDRAPSYEHGRAQKRWEEMSDLEYDLKEAYAKELATATAAQSVEPVVELATPPVRPTTLAERQFMKLVKEEQEHLERHQKNRQLARSFRDRDPSKFNYHSEPLPSGGSHTTLPLSSLLITPFYALRDRTSFIFSPAFRLGKMYADTFRPDELTGKSTQVRGLEKIYDQVTSGKVLEFGGKFLDKCGEVWGGWLGLGQGRTGKEDGGPGRGGGGERGRKDE